MAFDGTNTPANLRIEHLACNTKNVPPMLGRLPPPSVQQERARAGLPPYTEEEWTRERERTLTAFLANPPEPLPLAEAVRRHWRPGRAAWERWHAENPGVCDCQPGRPSQFCLPDVPG